MLAPTALLAAAAAIASLELAPGTVEISARDHYADVTLATDGAALRVEATALAWAQDDRGGVSLSPAEGLSVFPAALDVRPGEPRRVRISRLGGPPAVERAYRLRLAVRGADGEQRQILLPVFVEDPHPFTRTVLQVWAAPGGRVRVELHNGGSRRVRAVAADLEVVGSGPPEPLAAWWVLAGGSRAWERTVAAGTCTPGAPIVARVDLGDERLEARGELRCDR